MKKLYPAKLFIISIAMITNPGSFTFAQCAAGYNTAIANWDQLDYLSQTGTYAPFVTTAMMQNQAFTMGRNRFTINFPTASMTALGENTTNTAELGSYATGADVEYNGNGSITISFDAPVFNLRFSLYDLDQLQTVRVTATDASALPLNINMAAAAIGVIIVSGNGTPLPTATTTGIAVANNDTRASLNISIAGNNPPAATGVKTVTITMGFGNGAPGDFWLSDLSACVAGSFPLNYYLPEQPWTGQPGYYMVTPDNNSVYLMNPLTGKADWIFSEPNSPWVNSMAYDHVNKILYYMMDHPTPLSTNRSLKKYDFNTETISTVVADVRTLGIPLYEIVVESAGAAFYNGSLFLGIEGTNGPRNSNRESIIWRIDFNAAQVPIRASQVFARPSDNGSGLLTHDWGDFTIKDGTLFDFNTGNQGSTSQFVHYNMQTGNAVFYNTNGNPAPIQAGQTWNGILYWTGGQSPELGRVAVYNENGTIGPKIVATVTACSPPWVGRAGDASDPIRPKSDFGDAPVSYDPIHMEKATHEYDCNLRLGPTFDREWDKTPSALADADGTDEDGITTVKVLPPGTFNYVQPIDVYNNTGSNATLIGWLDHDNDGVFEPMEGRMVTVPSSPVMQTINVTWFALTTTLPIGTNTFARYRLTSSVHGMTISNATRWFPNGEVEDYRVRVALVLPVELLSFTATKETEKKILLKWTALNETNFSGYHIERSKDETNWENIGFVSAKENGQSSNQYSFYDNAPYTGTSYYRLRLSDKDGNFSYSEVRMIKIESSKTGISVMPNPAKDRAYVEFTLTNNESADIYVFDAIGRTVINKKLSLVAGLNRVELDQLEKLGSGVYIVQVVTESKKMSAKLIVQ